MSTAVEHPLLETGLLQPPPQPPQPHRPSTSCDRHPEEHFTGFCPSCLCERLAELEPNSTSASSSRKPPLITTSTATAALKAIFKPALAGPKPTSSYFPELRRTKSFSATKDEGLPGVFEPQRKSCDVRVRGTLWSLFSQEDERQPHSHTDRKADRAGPSNETVEVEPPRVSSSSLPRISTSSLPPPVFEEENEEETPQAISDSEIQNQIDNACFAEAEPHGFSSARDSSVRGIEEIVEADEQIVIEPVELLRNRSCFEKVEEVEQLKPMKEHIDLDSQAKKRDFKEIAGSFWSAASVFSKKLQKWRQKQKEKKQKREELMGGSRIGVFSGVNAGRLPVEKSIGRQFRETQSEVADYGFGRRSCDVDPRFSLDIGRMSFEDQPRYSLDEPRASWDGYLMPGRLSASAAFTKMPTMVEDCPFNVIANNINGIVNSHNSGTVLRSDGHIPVEFEDGCVPGGTAQTREYYFDTSSRRRRSLDRSNSIRKTAAAVVAEMDELKNVCNSKVAPAVAATDYLQDIKSFGSFSHRDDCSESFEMRCRDNGRYGSNGMRKIGSKKPWRWGRWSIWGFIHRRSINKDEDVDRYGKSNGMVERSFSESWQDLRGPSNGGLRCGGFNPKVGRSHSSVSWRSSNSFGSLGGSARKSNCDMNGVGKKEVLVVEKNRSARFSPTNVDNGMLRFYLTPMRASRRGVWGKGKSNHAHSIARSVLRLY